MIARTIVSVLLAASSAFLPQVQQGQRGQGGQQGQQGVQQGQQGQQGQGVQQGQGQGVGQGVAQGRGGRGQGALTTNVTVTATIYAANGEVIGAVTTTGRGGRGSVTAASIADSVDRLRDLRAGMANRVTIDARASADAANLSKTAKVDSPTTTFVGNGPSFCDQISAITDATSRMLNGWRVEIKPQSQDGTSAVTQVTWQRVRAGNQSASSPGGTVTLTVHPGDRIPLDYITAGSSSGACQAVGVALEVHGSYGRVAPDPPASLIESELWLVHKLPDGKEQTQHQVVRQRPGAAADYFFEDVTIGSSQGNVKVRIAGSISASPNALDAVNSVVFIDRQFFLANRRIGGGSASSPTPIQKTDDVLSFQMPALGTSSIVGRGVGAAGGRGAGAPGSSTVEFGVTGRGVATPAPPDAQTQQLLNEVLGHQFSLRVKTKVIK